MPKFKVGDKVIFNCPKHQRYHKQKATVIKVNPGQYDISYDDGRPDIWSTNAFEKDLGAKLFHDKPQYPEWF